MIHLIGLGGTITTEEYEKLATLWEGATADEVSTRVEYLRAQQILNVRAAPKVEQPNADENCDPAETIDDSDETVENKAGENALEIDAIPSSPLSTPPSSPQLKTPSPPPFLSTNTNTTAPPTPARKTVHFAPTIATVRTIRPRYSSDQKPWEAHRQRHWVPVPTSPWEKAMFAAEGRKRGREDDDSSSSRPTKRPRNEDEVPHPLAHTARSPAVPRVKPGSDVTASHRWRQCTPTRDARRAFVNTRAAWPEPVLARAAVAEGAEWLDEDGGEEVQWIEERGLKRWQRTQGLGDERVPARVGFLGGRVDWGEMVREAEADERWFEEGEEGEERDRGGVWAWEDEGAWDGRYREEDELEMEERRRKLEEDRKKLEEEREKARKAHEEKRKKRVEEEDAWAAFGQFGGPGASPW